MVCAAVSDGGCQGCGGNCVNMRRSFTSRYRRGSWSSDTSSGYVGRSVLTARVRSAVSGGHLSGRTPCRHMFSDVSCCGTGNIRMNMARCKTEVSRPTVRRFRAMPGSRCSLLTCKCRLFLRAAVQHVVAIAPLIVLDGLPRLSHRGALPGRAFGCHCSGRHMNELGSRCRVRMMMRA